MIVVSDTSPLNYLVLIEVVEVLPAVFTRVVVPPAVVEELQAPGAPDAVKAWIAAPPSWLEVRIPESSGTSLALGQAEREAICLAYELSALCLIDDLKESTSKSMFDRTTSSRPLRPPIPVRPRPSIPRLVSQPAG